MWEKSNNGVKVSNLAYFIVLFMQQNKVHSIYSTTQNRLLKSLQLLYRIFPTLQNWHFAISSKCVRKQVSIYTFVVTVGRKAISQKVLWFVLKLLLLNSFMYVCQKVNHMRIKIKILLKNIGCIYLQFPLIIPTLIPA